MTDRINCLSLHTFCQLYHTVLMYGILQLNTFQSGNFLIFVRSCHDMAWHTYKCVTNAINGLEFEQVCHKRLQCPCKCVNWNQTIYVWNTRIGYKIYVWCMLYCARRIWIGSPLNNFSQKWYPKQFPKVPMLDPLKLKNTEVVVWCRSL